MSDLQVSAVFDLRAEPTEASAKHLRDELLRRLQEKGSYGVFYEGSTRVERVLGQLVKVEFRHDTSNTWTLYRELPAQVVELQESGTDLFPTAGIYDGSTLPNQGIDGAKATVDWRRNQDYPLSEDVIERLVRERHILASSFTERIDLVMPVLCLRSWRLTLTAQSFEEALAAYALLRGGKWQPKTPFIDTLSDDGKMRVISQEVPKNDPEED